MRGRCKDEEVDRRWQKEGSGGVGSKSQRRTWLESTAEGMRGAENICELVSYNLMLLINFISLILSL